MSKQNKSPQRASAEGSQKDCSDSNLNRQNPDRLQPPHAIHVKPDGELFILQIVPPSKLTGGDAKPSSYTNAKGAMKAAKLLSHATGWPVTDLTGGAATKGNKGDKYPHFAGYKGRSTSFEAAKIVSKNLGHRQSQVYRAFKPYGASGATAYTIADDLGVPVHIVRPRISELDVLGKLFPLPQTRKGRLGFNVTAYSVVKQNGP